MPRQTLPIDLLNLMGEFVGDKFHQLYFELTPVLRLLSHKRIFMQARSKKDLKSKRFDYSAVNGNLKVAYTRRNYTTIVTELSASMSRIYWNLVVDDMRKLGIMSGEKLLHG